MIIGVPYLDLIWNVSNGGAFHKLVHGAEITIGSVLMLLVKLFFVKSLIVEADVFPGLKDLLVKTAATCRSLLLWMSLVAVAVADSSAMPVAAQAAEVWKHLSIDIPAGILTPFSL